MAKSRNSQHNIAANRREQGRLARSQDLVSAGVFLLALGLLALAGTSLVGYLSGLVSEQLGGEAWMSWIDADHAIDSAAVGDRWNAIAIGLAKALLPFVTLLVVAAIGLNVVQTGFVFLPDRLRPDAARINPLAGLRRVFSLSSGGRLTLGIVKIAVVAAVAGTCLYRQREELIWLAALDVPQIASATWRICLTTSAQIGVALVVLAVVDYGFERWKYERDLRMTPQEVREEMRNLQGDPQLAARRRGVQRQLATGRVTQSVPKAAVVIVGDNLAIALRYEPESMQAPLAIAKGAGQVAERVRALAATNGVLIVEDDALATSSIAK